MFDSFDVFTEFVFSRTGHEKQSAHDEGVQHDEQDGRDEIHEAQSKNQEHSRLQLLTRRSCVWNANPRQQKSFLKQKSMELGTFRTP